MQLSVIVPVYKVEAYLDQCVRSVLDQTFRDFELILVDDGSPDKCPAMCDAWAEKDSRVQVIHKENGGVQAAVITGLRAAAGSYIGYVDSDDWVAPDYFEKLVAAAEASGADLAVAGWTVHSGEQVLLEKPQAARQWREGDIERELLLAYWEDGKELPFGNNRWSKLWKADLLRRVAEDLDPLLCMGEDLEQVLRYLPLCAGVVTVPDCCGYFYRRNAASITQAFSEKVIGQYEQLKAVLGRIAAQQHRPYGAREKTESKYHFMCLYQMQASRQTMADYIRYTRMIQNMGPVVIQDHISGVFRIGFRLLEMKHYFLGSVYLRILFLICGIVFR